MKNNKSKKVFIISIIVIVVLLIVGVTFAMFATNIFKSNKDLFFEYAAQIFDKENGFIDNKLEQYSKKKSNSIYEHEGTFTASVDAETISQKTLDGIDNFSISFAGNIDNSANKMEELVKINYSSNSSFPILYKKANGIQGLKFKEISKRYFAVDEDELKDLITKATGNDTTGYGTSSSSKDAFEMINISAPTFKSEDIESFKNTYLPIIQDNLDKGSFTKISTSEGEGYSLEISDEKFREILIKLLETLKEDDVMLDKLSNISGTSISSYSIEALIENLNQLEATEGNSNITVYQKNNKLNKIQFQYNDEFKITISKTSSEDDASYIIELEGQDYSVSLNLAYSGLQNLEEIKENYVLTLNLGEMGTYTYNVENNVNFTNSDISIDNFEKNEYLDLGSLSEEKFGKLIETIAVAVVQSNSEKMEKAGLEGENPIISIIPGVNQSLALYNATDFGTFNASTNNDENTTADNNSENSNTDNNVANGSSDSNATSNSTNGEANSTTSGESSSSSSSLVDGMEKVTKESFNEKFKQYEGDNVKGNTVKSLIMQIIANNMIDDGRKIEVTGDIVLTGTEVPDSIESSKYYKVKCSTNSEGYVNKVDITEKK